MVELMKSRLHDNHDNQSTTKCFFDISCKNNILVKNHPISNGSTLESFEIALLFGSSSTEADDRFFFKLLS